VPLYVCVGMCCDVAGDNFYVMGVQVRHTYVNTEDIGLEMWRIYLHHILLMHHDVDDVSRPSGIYMINGGRMAI
jgi:hypothetical protein